MLEEQLDFGGALDAHGLTETGYFMSGSRMFESKYTCTFNLLASIPSGTDPRYNLKSWALFFGSSGITANWDVRPSDRWLVPVGTGVVKTFRLDKQTMQLAIYYFGNVVRPTGAPFGTIRFNYNLVFPITRGR